MKGSVGRAIKRLSQKYNPDGGPFREASGKKRGGAEAKFPERSVFARKRLTCTAAG